MIEILRLKFLLYDFFQQYCQTGKPPGLVVNAEDSQSEPPWMWVRFPASPKKLDKN